MAEKFFELGFTPSVREAQRRFYGASQGARGAVARDRLGPQEVEFIQTRDSFYLATINESGWPYIQHRGGNAGFLHVAGPTTLMFADYKGNRQLLSTGNLAANDRTALFLMDYPQRTRLKLLGNARVEDARARPDLVAQIAESKIQPLVERIFLIEVVAFDWNCPKYITPRYTAVEIEAMIAPLRARIAELETQLTSPPLK